MIRRYPTLRDADPAVAGDLGPPPLDSFARLAWAGIRLRDDGLELVAKIPPALAASPEWPRLDRLLTRDGPWLADVAAVVAGARKRFTLARVAARLQEISPPLAVAAYELAGGQRRFRALVRRPPTGARADLAFAIFAMLLQIEGLVGGVGVGVGACGVDEGEAGDAPPGRVLPFRPVAGEEGRSW